MRVAIQLQGPVDKKNSLQNIIKLQRNNNNWNTITGALKIHFAAAPFIFA